MTPDISIRPAEPGDHDTLADFFHAMWMDNGVPADDFNRDWKTKTLAFMKGVATTDRGQAFVALSGERLVGCAQCLMQRKFYALTLRPEVRTDGYLWGVYVTPDFRRQGLATRLTLACKEYLKSIGCTRMVLHASPTGKPVYAGLGFHPTNEMGIDL